MTAISAPFRFVNAVLTRAPGPFSVLESASQTLLRRWVPKWHDVFADERTPLFYERVGPAFKPILTGRRRFLSQLRQLAIYAHAACQRETFLFRPDLKRHAHALMTMFAGDEPGSWAFALDDAYQPEDRTQDLYTLAFVIFAMAHYARATSDPVARDHALATARRIDTRFRMDAGFAEALDAQDQIIPGRLRRHESHMHLLEACLDAAATWDDPIFRQLSDELADLFVTRFYDAEARVLSEYYDDALAPCPEHAGGPLVCEAGHYYEWIWLLKKHAQRASDPTRYDPVCLSLLSWANDYGWDREFGGIYDELTPQGAVISDRKRLWPLTEALKANALLLDIVPDRDATKAFMANVARMLSGVYIQRRGFWTEWLGRDLQPVADYMPATTPYHVYFGIMEARAALRARGVSKSLRLRPKSFAYALKRNISALLRRVR